MCAPAEHTFREPIAELEGPVTTDISTPVTTLAERINQRHDAVWTSIFVFCVCFAFHETKGGSHEKSPP